MRMSQHFIRAVLRNGVAEHEGVQQRTPTEPGALAPDGPKRPLSRLGGFISARPRDGRGGVKVDGFSAAKIGCLRACSCAHRYWLQRHRGTRPRDLSPQLITA